MMFYPRAGTFLFSIYEPKAQKEAVFGEKSDFFKKFQKKG
jgi:hypothetical protein